MTSSAMASSVGGTVRPSALAALEIDERPLGGLHYCNMKCWPMTVTVRRDRGDGDPASTHVRFASVALKNRPHRVSPQRYSAPAWTSELATRA
jgi:hypothetical protein